MSSIDWEDVAKHRYKKDRILFNNFNLENKKYIFSMKIKDNLTLQMLCYEKLKVKKIPYLARKSNKNIKNLNLLKILFPKNNFEQWIKIMEKIKDKNIAKKI